MSNPRRFAKFIVMIFGTIASLSDQGTAETINLGELRDWDIVVAESVQSCEKYAAEEFQDFYARASGVQLTINSKADRSGKHIFIGESPEMVSSPVGFISSELSPEDFRIRAANGNISIAGGSPRGTLYGVYQFLEDYLGVRFLTFDHTHVPKLSPLSTIDEIDRSYHPPLSFRFSFYGENFAHADFATRLRINTITDDSRLGGKTGRILINHSFGNQIPSKVYGEKHPEYFAERDGKRLAPVEDDWFGTEPCLTNPDVLGIVTEHVLKEIRENPQAENVSVCQNDNNKFCLCSRCAELDTREETPMGSLLTFVNAVAEKVEQDYPKVKVGTLAYWYSRKPPRHIVPRSNVQIQLCSIECCLAHPITDSTCPLNQAFCDDMRRWGEICNDISIWNYNTNFSSYQLPCPNLRVIEPNIRYFVENNAQGVFMQAAGNTTGAEFSDLRNYLISRLLWNPSLNGEELIREFLELHYGPAAPPIRRYIDLVHTEAQQSGKHRNCFGTLKDRGLSDEIGLQGIVLFEEASKLAPNEETRYRVEKASICAYRAAIEPTWILKADAQPEPSLIASQRPLVRRFFQLSERHGVSMVSERQSLSDRLKTYRQLFGISDSDEL
ncbi:MAG: DUF4838 domain-containing protein [Planctomycetaceae bacterium]|nr:DUF4838 domain-containing protein [Planctomycetaceae bacterium]